MMAVGVVILIALQSGAFSAGKSFFIKGTGINSLGTPLVAGPDKIKFYKTSGLITTDLLIYTPVAPPTLINDFNIGVGAVPDGAVDSMGSDAGRYIQADCIAGDTISATITTLGFTGANIATGSYYRKVSLDMNESNFNESNLTWGWNSLAINYKADSPYPPRITKFEEATTSFTDGSPTTSTLRVYSEAGTGTDGLREITGYHWYMWRPADPANPAADAPTTFTSDGAGITGAITQTLQIDTAAAGLPIGATYAFSAYNDNLWGSSGSPIQLHTIAAAGPVTPGGVSEINFDFKSTGMGINQFTLPFVPAYRGTNRITTIAELVARINTASTDPAHDVVKSVGWWNNISQIDQGYLVTGGTTPILNAVNGATETDLVVNKAYQITLRGDVTIRLTAAATP